VLTETQPRRGDLQSPCIQIDVTPSQPGYLAAAQPGEGKLPCDRISVAFDVVEHLLKFGGRKRVCRFRVGRNAVDELGDIAYYVALLHLVLQHRCQQSEHVVH
jgi:hypothetical protein